MTLATWSKSLQRIEKKELAKIRIKCQTKIWNDLEEDLSLYIGFLHKK
jgi:hypothetical protein